MMNNGNRRWKNPSLVIFTGIFLISLQLAGIDFGASRQAQIQDDVSTIVFGIDGSESIVLTPLPSDAIVSDTDIAISGEKRVELDFFSNMSDLSSFDVVTAGNTIKLAQRDTVLQVPVEDNWTLRDMAKTTDGARLRYSNQTVFRDPVRIDDTGNNDTWARSPVIASDNNGTIYAAWTDRRNGDSDIYYSILENGGNSFEKNLRVEDHSEGTHQTNPMIMIDELDVIHLVWSETDANNSNLTFRYSKSVDRGQSFEPSINPGMLIYSMSADKSGIPYFSSSCLYTKFDKENSSFGKPVPMYNEYNNTTMDISIGNIILDENNTIHSIFKVESKGIIYATSVDGVNFSNSLVTNFGYEPYILIDRDGTISAVWWTGECVHISQKKPGEGGFKEITNLTVLDVYPYSSADIDSNGVIHLTWMGRIHYAAYSAVDGWNVKTVAPDGDFPRIVINKNDAVNIAYERYSNISGYDVFYLRGNRAHWPAGVALSPTIDLRCSPSRLRVYANSTCPAGTSIAVQSRASDDNESWSDWGPVIEGVPRMASRYIQLRFELSTENATATPVLYGTNLEYSHYAPRGSVVSSLALREDIISAAVSGELTLDGQAVVLSLSNDNGSHWHEASVDVPLTFPTRGQQLGFRAIFLSNGSSTGSLKNFNISFTVESYPTNPAVYVGDGGAAVWSQFGTFNSTATLPDLSGVFNEYIAAHRNQSENGTVAVPIRFASDTCGIINVTEFDIVYNVPPRIASREPDKPSVTVPEGGSIHFVMNATDSDGDLLAYRWYLDGSPAGVNSSVFDYRPGYESAGNHAVAVEVSDGRSDLTSSWNVTVTNMNRPPVVTAFTPRSPVTVVIGNAPRFNVEAFDPDNDTIAFSWTLDGKGTAGNGSALILGTSGIGPGRHVLKVHISDGTGSAEQTWTVDVKARNGVESDPVPYMLAGALLTVLIAASVYLFRKRGKKKEP